MTSAARTVGLFGIHPITSGVLLAAAPDAILGLVGLPPDDGPWVRILGLVSAALGVQYVVAARTGSGGFIRASVPLRLVVSAGLVAAAATSPRHRIVAAFAVPEVAGAAWTWRALRDQPRPIA